MVFFNYALRKLNAKIVYYGPGPVSYTHLRAHET